MKQILLLLTMASVILLSAILIEIHNCPIPDFTLEQTINIQLEECLEDE